jgi:K+-transporting ATPase c subunit
MTKKFVKAFIVLIMLVGLIFSAINFIVPNQAFAEKPNGDDVTDENGDACDCKPGGSQCVIVMPKPPVN